jgi:signal transduction histidine kinase/uncharacterized protein (DUF1778 family)
MPSEVSTVTGEQSVEALRRELAEAREQQAATVEILASISSSVTDANQVFAKIAASAARLCDANDATIFQVDGDLLRRVANNASIPQYETRGDDTMPLTREVVGGRAVLDGKTIQVADVQAEMGEYPEGSHRARRVGHRTILAVPLMRVGEAIGVIAIRRTEVRQFTDRQIDLLKTFADQAVIAIENARLFKAEQASKRELTEALEYQMATSDVLGVIAASPTNIRPVLQTLVDSACRLCAAYDGIILLREGDWLQVRAHHGPIPVNVEKRKITRDWVNGRCVADGVQIHVEDLQAEVAEYPEGAALAQRLGARTILTTPLMREGEAIGAIMIRRDEVRPFSDKQIGLIQTFARQAVIAIENTRLFEQVQARTRELTEALDQQTATADVLKAISRSAFDVQKVLDTLIEAAVKLTGAKTGILRRREADVYPLVASFGLKPEWHELIGQLANAPGRDTLVGRVTLERRTVQIPDVFADPDFSNLEAARVIGFRANIGTPLHRDGQMIGYMAFQKETVGPFATRQVELIETFANQAVIAIENTRLFEEVQARTRELAKTVENLEIASQHKNQFVANMSHELRTPLAAILGYAELIQEGFYEPQGPKSLDALARIRSNGKHLLGLINTVLDIAKIESGQFTLNMAEYAIESVVETVRSATESLAQNKKLALKTEVAKSLPIGLGDEQRLTQVLLNLVGNAIKFTDTGEVRVTAKAVNGHFSVSVADTGPGIPEQEQKRIFEQFHQIDTSLTKAKGGTGLGLAIAKQIVEMHGGRIWVESTLGKGAIFQMELPTRAELRSAP